MRIETLSEQLFFSTGLIETRQPGGKVVTGTGFFYAVFTTPEYGHIYLVSNKHVLIPAEAITVTACASSSEGPLLGTPSTVTIHPSGVVGHPSPNVDVAIINVSSWINDESIAPYIKPIRQDNQLKSEDLQHIDAVESVRFVGYPAGIFDRQNFLPVMRSGTTATPIENDYEGEKSFLIDASVYPGSSGSPVFLLDSTGIFQARDGSSQVGRRFFFLGVVAAVHTRQVSGQIVTVPAGTLVKIDDPIDLGIVFKASVIDDIIAIYPLS